MREYKKIKIRDIALNKKPFSFSFPDIDEFLLDSISDIGITTPLLVIPHHESNKSAAGKRANKFLVVSGLRRVMACKRSGIKEVPCFIINEDKQDYEKLLLLNLKTNLSHRGLNDIEKALFLELMHEAGVPREKIIDKYMPELHLEKSRKIYEDIMGLNALDKKSRARVVEWQLPLKMSAALARYSGPDRLKVIKLAEMLNPGINRLKEIMLFLEEIALLKKCSIAKIVEKHLSKIIKDSKKSKKERTEMLRRKLKELRYPGLSKLEKKWNEFIKDLHLPPEIKISPPVSFEGKKIKLEISFSSKDSMDESLHKLGDSLTAEPLLKLIKLVKGPK